MLVERFLTNPASFSGKTGSEKVFFLLELGWLISVK
jgi:hypothetical protein